MSDFTSKLRDLINTTSMENGSDTPDHILAEYMTDCLVAFDKAVVKRNKFYNSAKVAMGDGSGS